MKGNEVFFELRRKWSQEESDRVGGPQGMKEGPAQRSCDRRGLPEETGLVYAAPVCNIEKEARIKTTEVQLHGQCGWQEGGTIGQNRQQQTHHTSSKRSTLANVFSPSSSQCGIGTKTTGKPGHSTLGCATLIFDGFAGGGVLFTFETGCMEPVPVESRSRLRQSASGTGRPCKRNPADARRTP